MGTGAAEAREQTFRAAAHPHDTFLGFRAAVIRAGGRQHAGRRRLVARMGAGERRFPAVRPRTAFPVASPSRRCDRIALTGAES